MKKVEGIIKNSGKRGYSKVYESCIRSVILYGRETWALTGRLANTSLGCDRKILRYMAGVSWSDRVSSLEVAGRCGVRELGAVLRGRMLGWFGHAVRRDEAEILRRTQLIEVTGRRPLEGPRKTCTKKNMQEELASQHLQEEQALNRDQKRTVINHLTS